MRSPALAISLCALLCALGAPAWAAHLFTGRDVKNHSLAVRDFSARAVTQLQRTPDRSVPQYALRSHAVKRRNLASGSVGGLQVADGTLTGADFKRHTLAGLPAGSVTHTELRRSSVGIGQMQDGIVDKDTLQGKSVGTDQVAGLRAVDLRGVQTVANVTYGAITAGRCATRTFDAGERVGRIANVGRPATLPDTVTLTARRGTTRVNVVRITACNHGDAAVTPGAQSVPVLAPR